MSRFTLLAESGPVSLDLTLFGHTAMVLEPAFFPGGRHLAAIAGDDTMRTVHLCLSTSSCGSLTSG
jgi:hypothetical protein